MLRAIPIAIALALTAPAISVAAESTVPAEQAALIESFLHTLKTADASKALGNAFEGGVLAGSTTAASAMMDGMLKMMGPLNDWKPIAEQQIDSTFVVRTYYARTREFPVFFQFQLYRAVNTWRIVDVKFYTYNEFVKQFGDPLKANR